MAEKIDIFINRKIVVLNENEPSAHVARAMRDNGVGMVLLADQLGHVTGLVTDRDLTLRLIAESISTQISVNQLMRRDIVSVSPEAGLKDVVDLMKMHGIRRIPVFKTVEENKTGCVGLISLDDLLAAKAISPEDVSAIIQSQVRRRAPLARPQREYAKMTILQSIQEKAGQHVVIDEAVAHEAVRLILKALVRRLHLTAAYSLTSLLPPELRFELRDLPPGPDRSIDARSVRVDLMSRLGISEEIATVLSQAVWASLEGNLGAVHLRHVLAQLPPDLRELLAPNARLGYRENFEEWPQMDASFS